MNGEDCARCSKKDLFREIGGVESGGGGEDEVEGYVRAKAVAPCTSKSCSGEVGEVGADTCGGDETSTTLSGEDVCR